LTECLRGPAAFESEAVEWECGRHHQHVRDAGFDEITWDMFTDQSRSAPIQLLSRLVGSEVDLAFILRCGWRKLAERGTEGSTPFIIYHPSSQTPQHNGRIVMSSGWEWGEFRDGRTPKDQSAGRTRSHWPHCWTCADGRRAAEGRHDFVGASGCDEEREEKRSARHPAIAP